VRAERGAGLGAEGGGARLRGDLDAAHVVRARGALHEALDGVELAAHLLHHRQRGLAHALHGHRAEPVRQHGAHQQARKHLRARAARRRPWIS